MVWRNRLIKKARIDSPVVEVTPLVWDERLILAETWHTHWESPEKPTGEHYVRFRDEANGRIIGKCFEGFAFASALVWRRKMHVFAGRTQACGEEYLSQDVHMACSKDLRDWSPARCVISGAEGEKIWNQSVCWDGSRFVMAYETDSHVKFTIKFAVSDNLWDWRKLPEAIYGADWYTACPTLRYARGYYYMLYTEYRRPRWWFETWLTRSRDLIMWETAPHNPVLAPDASQPVHPHCPEHPSANSPWRAKVWQTQDAPGEISFASTEECPARGRECNASDADLLEWQGRTRVYFTGGCQHWGGYLQYAEFDGPMAEFYESYYA